MEPELTQGGGFVGEDFGRGPEFFRREDFQAGGHAGGGVAERNFPGIIQLPPEDRCAKE
jgi:hypothetical protein